MIVRLLRIVRRKFFRTSTEEAEDALAEIEEVFAKIEALNIPDRIARLRASNEKIKATVQEVGGLTERAKIILQTS